jgi:hypothetical protein
METQENSRTLNRSGNDRKPERILNRVFRRLRKNSVLVRFGGSRDFGGCLRTLVHQD